MIGLLLAVVLLAWTTWFSDKLHVATPARKKARPASVNTAPENLFKAIAPFRKPTPQPASLPVAKVEKTAPKPTVFAPRIKQRDNKQQSHTRFEKIAFNGDKLPDDVIDWACSLDVDSGLLWETKLSNGGISDARHTYSWYAPDHAAKQQGKPDGGDCYGSQCDTYSYIEAMNNMTLCGTSAWRLPHFSELERLIDREYYDPTINQKFFPHSLGTVYWSGTELKNNPEMVMQVDFFNGISNAVPKNLSYSIRVVSEP